MPSEDTEILEVNQYRKSDKAVFIIYADLESLIVKIAGCISPGKLFMKKVSEDIPYGFSTSKISSFTGIEIKHRHRYKTIWESLREHVMKITSFKNKEMKLLTIQQQELYEN